MIAHGNMIKYDPTLMDLSHLSSNFFVVQT